MSTNFPKHYLNYPLFDYIWDSKILWMKIFTKILALFIIVVAIGSASCRRSNNSKYFYDSKKDTSAPKINISVPLQNDNYNYGEDIHIVGTVTDLQTVGFGGKLQTLNIKVEELNDLDSVYIADLLVKTLLF